MRNDNSSRFGKLIVSDFDADGRIVGCSAKQFLLEKSRIVYQAADERNYHAIYYLAGAFFRSFLFDDFICIITGLSTYLYFILYDDCVAGAKADAALCNGDLGIESPSEFHYLNQGECFDVKGVDDKAEFDELCRGLSEMGVVDDVQAELWKVLAGVVHLGNVTFCEEEGATGMMAAVDPGAASFVTKASSLLGVNAAALEMGMKRRSVTTRAAAAGRRASMHMIPLTVRTDPGSREGAFNF